MKRPQRLEFENNPRNDWGIGALPRVPLPVFLRRLLRRDSDSDTLRSLDASHRPALNTSDWREGRTTVGNICMRAPADLPYVEPNNPDESALASGEILVGLWQDQERSFAIHRGGEERFRLTVYSLSERPRREEWSEHTTVLSGREVKIATARVSLRHSGAVYQVLAYWPISSAEWMTASGAGTSRTHQEEFLAMLRSMVTQE